MERIARTGTALLAAGLMFWQSGCERTEPQRVTLASPPAVETDSSTSSAPTASGTVEQSPAASAASVLAPSVGSAAPAPLPEPRTLRFAWRPAGGEAQAYAMSDPEDQHRIVLTRGVLSGGSHPVVIGFHGQPSRWQAPRDYGFPGTVTSVVVDLVERGEVEPVVLVIPVFRFRGENWPRFDVVSFFKEVSDVLGREGISPSRTLLFGHSGAAGCGGDGLNRAHELQPAAVGFFDTCVGATFVREAQALLRARIPTLIVHSLETAGFRPRQVTEYLPTFDFGKVYAPIGLQPSEACPETTPEAPLRPQRYRCASDPDGIVRAFVVDTGTGQAGHDAVVPVALRYFLRTYAAAKPD